MLNIIYRNWWIWLFQGLVLVSLGLLTILSNNFDLSSFIQWLGLTLLLFGAILSFWAVKARQKSKSWVNLMAMGTLEIMVGAYIIYNPVYALSIFSLIVGGWAIAIGVYQGFLAVRTTANKLVFLFNGLISITFGLLIIFNPFESDKAVTYLIALYSILLGVSILSLSIKARKAYLFSKEQVQEG